MYKIAITEEQVGPSLAVGRDEAEAVACVVAYVTSADWGGTPYHNAWHAAREARATPSTLEELDAWLIELHETAQVAQNLAQTTAPFGVEAYDDWLERGGHSLDYDDLIEPCQHLQTVARADAIVRQLQEPLGYTNDLTASSLRILCVEGTGLSRPAALAGAAVMRAAKRVTTRVRLADVVSALEQLHTSTSDDIYATSRQAIQDRLRVWSFNVNLTDEPTTHEILTADQREED